MQWNMFSTTSVAAVVVTFMVELTSVQYMYVQGVQSADCWNRG